MGYLSQEERAYLSKWSYTPGTAAPPTDMHPPLMRTFHEEMLHWDYLEETRPHVFDTPDILLLNRLRELSAGLARYSSPASVGFAEAYARLPEGREVLRGLLPCALRYPETTKPAKRLSALEELARPPAPEGVAVQRHYEALRGFSRGLSGGETQLLDWMLAPLSAKRTAVFDEPGEATVGAYREAVELLLHGDYMVSMVFRGYRRGVHEALLSLAQEEEVRLETALMLCEGGLSEGT